MAERLEGNRAAEAAGNVLLPGFQKHMNQLLQDLDAEAVADKAMQEEFLKKPDAEDAGVDVSGIKTADAGFDDHEVVSIARECFYIVKNARSQEQPDFGEAELSPELEAELRQEVAGDVTAHRHHLLPALEIDDARIESATTLPDGREQVVIRFSLAGEQLDRDDAANVVSGSEAVVRWQEDWTLQRDPRTDSSAADREMTLMRDQWKLAHKGWVVTAMQRTGGGEAA